MIYSLYHYQPYCREHLHSLLCELKIKFSRIDKFNDPWDCLVHYKPPKNCNELARDLDFIKQAYRNQFPKIDELERDRRVEELRVNPKKLAAAMTDSLPDLNAAIAKQYRIYCLTEKADNLLMWAHYAKAHTGICLEFDARITPFSEESGAQKVKYFSEYPEYRLDNVGLGPLISKSIDWEYEQEWRLIAQDSKNARGNNTLITNDDFTTYQYGLLKTIIMGIRIDEKAREEIKEIIKKFAPDVKLKQAEIVSGRYMINISQAI